VEREEILTRLFPLLLRELGFGRRGEYRIRLGMRASAGGGKRSTGTRQVARPGIIDYFIIWRRYKDGEDFNEDPRGFAEKKRIGESTR